ncbi:hypothetical protein M422DRAFT_34620 [Sphaerobolus stellatus SS14]|uniref:Uncharacterized protein n=1 Tax=Sphaerobolus stellatus (strain SS14) TaxID=990650 RepID=A0A0C9VDV0_SPHS4|nr:hypothetical protein M422DRAFT_34620 [Sphaerobolus stellatus SS14]
MVGKQKCPFNVGNCLGRPQMFDLTKLSKDGNTLHRALLHLHHRLIWRIGP